MNEESNDLIMRNSVFGWIVVATGLLLLIPLIAMQFSTQVDWGPRRLRHHGCHANHFFERIRAGREKHIEARAHNNGGLRL